jgi:hypothetical protein
MRIILPPSWKKKEWSEEESRRSGVQYSKPECAGMEYCTIETLFVIY